MISLLYSFIIFLYILIAESFGHDNKLIVCKLPENFTIKVSNERSVEVYAAELLITFEDVGVYLYPGTNVINVVYNESTVDFAACMILKSFVNPESSSKTIQWSNNGIMMGIGKIDLSSQETSSKRYKLQQYDLFINTNSKDSHHLPYEIKSEVLEQVRLCLRKRFYLDVKNIAEFVKPFSPQNNSINELNKISQSCESSLPSKINFNHLVDLTLMEIIKILELKNLHRIKLADIRKEFSTGVSIFKANGQFKASGGYFKGLTTISRTADAILFQDGRKYTISCGFGLSEIQIVFDHYQLKYGFINVNGKISGNVKGLSLEAKASINDAVIPCTATIDYIKVTKFGKLNIQFTGLGILNSLASTMVSWLTKLWQKEIKRLIEQDLAIIFESQLVSYTACVKYKKAELFPWLQI